ncbi:hypothetical protein FGRMN_9523 [Fusarium graminum]|nr:hypothetical protein FGRMN_9523 [Fusarium graminum]
MAAVRTTAIGQVAEHSQQAPSFDHLDSSTLCPFIRLFGFVPIYNPTVLQRPHEMAERKPANRGRKTKTGCATCRIRKIKCDETKPACQKCVKTGRTCDGYESPFRPFPNPPMNDNRGVNLESNAGNTIPDAGTVKTPLDVASLNRYFSTKTIFDVDLGCNQEAHQVLQASLTDPSIRHALLSLRALRENLEIYEDSTVTLEQQTLSYNYGLEQYSKALTGLASNLAYPDSDRLKSALLCCQVLISVEQVRGNFSAMALHLIRGLNIMREYQPRPYLTLGGLMPPRYACLPTLDVFTIKMFAAPCRFSEPPAKSTSIITPPAESSSDRRLAPNMKTELVRIATSTLEFLSRVSRARPESEVSSLIRDREALLDSLDVWINALDTLQAETRPQEEPIQASFLRLFHLVLRIVLLGNLDTSTDLDAELRTDNERLQVQTMHFFLLGATGRTGKLVVSELLSQNHTAIALVRNPSSLTAQPGLTIVTGSPLSKDDIRRALKATPGQLPSAAIMTLNANRKSESPLAAPLSPPRFLADSCDNACEVLKEVGIHRFVVMSTAGVGDSWGNLPLLSRAFMGLTNVKYALEDHGLLDEEI